MTQTGRSLPLERTTFRWIGSKWRIMPKLIPLIPDHRTWVSVFGGAGSEIARKPRSHVEIYNDINADLFNVFEVLRDEPQRAALCQRLRFSPRSRLHFNRCLELLHSDDVKPSDRAFAFLYVSAYGFSGIDPGIATPGSFCVRNVRNNGTWEAAVHHIDAIGRRFYQVILERRDWRDLIDRYDAADAFLYLDPPYVLSTRVSPNLYSHEMKNEEHIELAVRLRTVNGLVMLSGYHNAIYEEILSDWRTVEFQTISTASAAKQKPTRTEVVWLNYTTDGKRIAG